MVLIQTYLKKTLANNAHFLENVFKCSVFAEFVLTFRNCRLEVGRVAKNDKLAISSESG